VRRRVGAFLHDLFRQGAFQGRTPQEAYVVRCGSDTMTQEDIDGGMVNVEIGFAPLRPAEFVVIRIGQWRDAVSRPYQPIP
jgi:phage tail sheath protein FI